MVARMNANAMPNGGRGPSTHTVSVRNQEAMRAYCTFVRTRARGVTTLQNSPLIAKREASRAKRYALGARELFDKSDRLDHSIAKARARARAPVGVGLARLARLARLYSRRLLASMQINAVLAEFSEAVLLRDAAAARVLL